MSQSGEPALSGHTQPSEHDDDDSYLIDNSQDKVA